ncbi:MAG: hypothetical protein QM802_07855 [Agriterribacter sp.]
MKSKLYLTVLLIASVGFYQQTFSQANAALSNLVTPTAVNQTITPNSTNNFSLGSGTYNWKNLYMGTAYYLKNLRILHAPGNTNFFAGPSAGNAATTGTNNTSLGDNTLIFVSSGGFNTAVGFTALRGTTTGSRNSALGYTALYNNSSGGFNVAVGDRALYVNSSGGANTVNGATSMFFNTNGSNNSAYGYAALYNNTTGANNTSVGYQALYKNTTGTKNTTIGNLADVNVNNLTNATAIGSNALVNTSNSLVLGSISGVNGATATVNVGIGTGSPVSRLHVVGAQLLDGNLTFGTGTESIQFASPGTTPAPMMYMFPSGTVNTDRMVIAHSPSYPSWGLRYSDLSDDFDFLSNGTSVMRVDLGSQLVGIGTTTPAYKLDVCGTIRAKEVRVETGWCDYVFEKDYKLRSIEELEKYINDNKHLPGIAPAETVEKEGLKVAEMNKAMMEKIEELSLYVIQLSKENKKLQAEVEALKQK